eukprot:scaffold286169_cov16-Tisochrysis_lutea.AAC.1
MPTEKAVCMRKGPLSVSSNVAPHFLSIAQGQISNMVALQEYSAAEQKSAEQRVQVYKAIWWVDQNKTGQVLFAVGVWQSPPWQAGSLGLGTGTPATSYWTHAQLQWSTLTWALPLS